MLEYVDQFPRGRKMVRVVVIGSLFKKIMVSIDYAHIIVRVLFLDSPLRDCEVDKPHRGRGHSLVEKERPVF